MINNEFIIDLILLSQEWKSSHWKLCIPTPFIPIFRTQQTDAKTSGEPNQNSAPLAADTTQTEWKSANFAPIRYCQTYPNLKVSVATQIENDREEGPEWLHDQSKEVGPPPTYDEAIKQGDGFVDVDFMSSFIPIDSSKPTNTNGNQNHIKNSNKK